MSSPVIDPAASGWARCRYLTCSVLPVRMACNCDCKFCFSKSSVSALSAERVDWRALDVDAYYRDARERGARRLVVTGGGEPLLRPDDVVHLVSRGRRFFDEIALFTNGTFLTRPLAQRLADAGLSYVCYSRHHFDDDANAALMGPSAPRLDELLERARGLRVRATCVMTRGNIEHDDDVWRYVDVMLEHGVRELTFKHTYVAYSRSVFRGSAADAWARAHQVERDPFEHHGTIIETLPWGPVVRRIQRHGRECIVCHYREPTPTWELRHRIGRSLNLLSDGSVFGSLEDERSRLFRLSSSPGPSRSTRSRGSDPCCPSGTEPAPGPTRTPSPGSTTSR